MERRSDDDSSALVGELPTLSAVEVPRRTLGSRMTGGGYVHIQSKFS
jgi:hypothetical protein